MSSTNRAGLRAGVLGLMLGCAPAVWLVGLAVAQADGRQEGQSGQPVVPATQQELSARFPMKSLAERLSYETTSRPIHFRTEIAPRVAKATERRLAAVEQKLESKWFNERTGRLMELYTAPVLHLSNPSGPVQFGMLGGIGGMFGGVGGSFGQPGGIGGGSPGQPIGQFGQAGAFHLTQQQLELPPAPAIPFAAVQAPSRVGGGHHFPTQERLAHLHENALADFLNPSGFGYVLDLGHVAGFQPHQFRRMPVLFTQENAPAGKVERWAVVRLELVSLRRHNRPCVYVADALPRIVDSQEGPTRPLAPFEAKALEALTAGDDLATETSGDRIRMVGSLRAAKQCLECHDAKRGDLLGAFSWELQRQRVGDP